MKNVSEKEIGITLIALVVTIIILLILAGVTIGVATNGTSLFEKAKLATDEYNNKAEQEETELSKATNEINSYIDGNRNFSNINFSTEEQDTGIKWVDGKTIYQKTLVSTETYRLLSTGDWQNVPGWSQEFTNTDKFISAESHYSWSKRTDWNENIAQNGNKYLKFYSLLSWFDIPSGTYLTVQYTKTEN